MIATYTMVDYKNYGDIQGQAHYVGVGIQTISLQVHFTTGGTYDHCEMSFSK